MLRRLFAKKTVRGVFRARHHGDGGKRGHGIISCQAFGFRAALAFEELDLNFEVLFKQTTRFGCIGSDAEHFEFA